MALPTYQGKGGANGSSLSAVVSWPTHQAGDIALLFVQSVGAEPVTLSSNPDGFQEISGSPVYFGSGTSGSRLTVFWCRATSTSMSSVTVADAGDHVYCIIVTFRGCIASGNPVHLTAGGTRETPGTTATFEPLTTTINDCLIVLAAGRDTDSLSAFFSGWTGAGLSSLTERHDSGATDGVGGGLGIATGGLATAGGTGSLSATCTSCMDAHLTIALAPEPVPLTQSLSDTLTLSDDNAGYPYHWPQPLADEIVLSDSPGTLHGHGRSLADQLTLSEELVADHHDASLSLELADGLTLSDQQLTAHVPEEPIPPVFPIPPGGERVLIHGYRTDVIGDSEDGHEQRVRLREIPLHGLELDWKDGGTGEAQLLAGLLYRSEAPWVVPYWPGMTAAAREAAPGSGRVYLPDGFWETSLWALWALEAAAGALYVVLWRSAWDCEAQRLTGHDSDVQGDYLTLAAGPVSTWPAGTRVVPGTIGYLQGEGTRERVSVRAKRGRVRLRSPGAV